jgi:hypothetical protein
MTFAARHHDGCSRLPPKLCSSFDVFDNYLFLLLLFSHLFSLRPGRWLLRSNAWICVELVIGG